MEHITSKEGTIMEHITSKEGTIMEHITSKEGTIMERITSKEGTIMEHIKRFLTGLCVFAAFAAIAGVVVLPIYFTWTLKPLLILGSLGLIYVVGAVCREGGKLPNYYLN